MREIIEKFKKTIFFLIRAVNSSRFYYLSTRSVKPLSSKFGLDRGTPIDRYWIDSFIYENRKFIFGRVLEIGDNRYTKKYGAKSVTKSDVLDIDRQNKTASIYGDLKDLREVSSNTYDCIILTHVLGMIDNYESAIKECKRILKIGGILLVTSSCFSPTHDINNNFFRFTYSSAKYIFKKIFRRGIFVKTYGNVLAGQAFWVGMAQEELTKNELEFNDPHYPCIVAIRATKTKGDLLI